MDNTKRNPLKQILIEKFLRSSESHKYNLNANDRILLTMIASYMGYKNECWPSYETLMLDTGIGSKTTINKSLLKLESLIFLFVKRKHRESNNYSFTDSFLNSCVQIWTHSVHFEGSLRTDMDSNNINNNNKNNNGFANFKNQKPKAFTNEPKQTAKFWGKGHPDYDRLHKND